MSVPALSFRMTTTCLVSTVRHPHYRGDLRPLKPPLLQCKWKSVHFLNQNLNRYVPCLQNCRTRNSGSGSLKAITAYLIRKFSNLLQFLFLIYLSAQHLKGLCYPQAVAGTQPPTPLGQCRAHLPFRAFPERSQTGESKNPWNNLGTNGLDHYFGT